MVHIYLDHAATSPTHPEVVEFMLPYLQEHFGNPSSIHHFGRRSRMIIDEARETAAKSIGAKVNEIVFTSGGTEADNFAITGVAYANRDKGNHIITAQIEHHAVLHTCKMLEEDGFEVTYLPVNEDGLISLEDLKGAIRESTILVTVMYGNNEVGTVQPIKEIGAYLAPLDIYFHTDAVQAYGLETINVNELNVDLLSTSSHKINGPKGVGFLFVKDGTNVKPHFYGGEQERKRRAGTENVAGIAGLKYAIELSQRSRQERYKLYESFKDKMKSMLLQENIQFEINGYEKNSLPHIMNISFPGTNVESLLTNLDLGGIAVSSGSACTAGTIDPSHVLVAMFGKGSERVQSSVRFSFGYGNTIDDIEKAAKITAKIVKRLTT